ncbi:transcriptional regulator [Priestia megaterium]|uniref:transcriptional regulator n=1 Tax=Priestia megaterium TaxID=1404 RepID=UPI000BFC4607|nr:transcriptional regulator [Priestia megaterium]PGZ76941.1 transcriptional regulator [Priestia megaterium]
MLFNKLGQTRTKFGYWIDSQKDINQSKIINASGMSKGTIYRLCNDPNFRPKHSTVACINKGLKKLKKNVKVEDFFNL